MKNSIAALIRYKGQGLVSWFQTFQPLVNKYKKAIGLATTLNEDELKALWKENFARQITVSERSKPGLCAPPYLGCAPHHMSLVLLLAVAVSEVTRIGGKF